jgi:hypothetical protein
MAKGQRNRPIGTEAVLVLTAVNVMSPASVGELESSLSGRLGRAGVEGILAQLEKAGLVTQTKTERWAITWSGVLSCPVEKARDVARMKYLWEVAERGDGP